MSAEPKTIGDESIVDLTKREAFAMHALAGLLSNIPALRREGFNDRDLPLFAVMQADALIAELAKGPPR